MLNELIKKVGPALSSKMPQILTGAGITAMAAGAIMAAKATPKAKYIWESQVKPEAKVTELAPEQQKELGKEIVTKLVPMYIPAVATFVLGAASVITAQRVQGDRLAAVLGAYTVAEDTVKRLESKISEKLGEATLDDISSEIATDRMEETPFDEDEAVDTGKGTTLCFDPLSGRYFYSDIAAIKSAETAVMEQLLSEMEVTVNDFYEALGLNSIGMGSYFGWRAELAAAPRIRFASKLDEESTPCLVLDYTPICLASFAHPIVRD